MTQNRQNQLSITASRNKSILIDDDSVQIKGKFVNTIETIGPLPAFQKHDNLTKLLYSKFMVKGVKPINEEAILSKLGKNSSTKHNRKSTQAYTNHSKEMIVRERSAHHPS